MGSGVVQIFYCDYRQEGVPQLVVVDSEGNVKGLNLTRNMRQFQQATTEVPEQLEIKQAEARLTELNHRKIDLQNKLDALKQKKQPKSQAHLQPPTRSDIAIEHVADPN